MSYIISGEQRAVCALGAVTIPTGSVAAWHTSTALEFEAVRAVHKLTLLFDDSEFGRPFPKAPNQWCMVAGPDDPAGLMLGGFLGSMQGQLHSWSRRHKAAAAGMARELLVRTLWLQDEESGRAPREELIDQLLQHVDAKLHEVNLSPESIAATYGISVRYVHLLFSRRGTTVAAWIRQRRLERCREALVHADPSVTITRIALQWGFSDASHFSRLFRDAYGVAPKEYRRQAGLVGGGEQVAPSGLRHEGDYLE